MSLRQKYLTALAHLAPLGAAGVSIVLGAAPAAASEPPDRVQTQQKSGVSERLAAVRDAVSAIDRDRAAAAQDEGRLAWGNWGWGNRGGWGWPNWNNWHNWRNWGNFFHNW